MVKRIRLGLIYSYDQNWIGGTYYIRNLIAALNTLDDHTKPFIVLVCGSDKGLDCIRELHYPYLEYLNISPHENIVVKMINKAYKYFHKNKLFNYHIPPQYVDIIYPAIINDHRFKNVEKKIFWIPDFQDKHLPEFFSNEELLKRKRWHEDIITSCSPIIFSSKDSLSDFNNFFPNAKVRTYVCNFSVSHPDFSKLEINDIRRKYAIPDIPYFFVANQFWRHKNHSVVIEAMKQTKDMDYKIVFSGSTLDYRDPNYFSELMEKIKNSGLEDKIIFIGFVDRKEQLLLMKYSVAIIQPSKFEGWSTVVEDAKALKKNIIVSSINVHKEQLGENGRYFNPESPDDLADILRKAIVSKEDINFGTYSDQIRSCANQFLYVLESEMKIEKLY